MEKERVGGLCVVVTVQVKITEFVQVPVWGKGAELPGAAIRRQGQVGATQDNWAPLGVPRKSSTPASVTITTSCICGALRVRPTGPMLSVSSASGHLILVTSL